MIPLLIITDKKQKKELENLANELEAYGAGVRMRPYLTENINKATDIIWENQKNLFLTILPRKGQEFYDTLKKRGYKYKFVVVSSGVINQQEWEGRDVGFMTLDQDGFKNYRGIEDQILSL